MELLSDRINTLQLLSTDKDINHEIDVLNTKIRIIYNELPELEVLTDLDFPRVTPESLQDTHGKINLLLSNYTQFKQVVEDLVQVNSNILNFIRPGDLDLSPILAKRVKLVRLTEQYLQGCIKSLIVIQKFITASTQQNEFFMEINEKLMTISKCIDDIGAGQY